MRYAQFSGLSRSPGTAKARALHPIAPAQPDSRGIRPDKLMMRLFAAPI